MVSMELNEAMKCLHEFTTVIWINNGKKIHSRRRSNVFGVARFCLAQI